MEVTASGLPVPELTEQRSSVTVLCVDDDPGYLDLLEAWLGDDDRFTVLAEPNPASALARLEAADCVVCDYDMPEMDGHEMLEEVRTREAALPFVLLTSYGQSEVAEPVLERPATDYVRKSSVSTTVEVLSRRVLALVESQLVVTLTQRALTALETVQSGVALTDADGRFVFADPAFECRFGHETGGLEGVSWRTVFAEEEVERIEGSRLSAVAEGWRWSGNCVARARDGSTFTVSTTVTGLEDGSLVFTVSADGTTDAPASSEEASSGDGSSDRASSSEAATDERDAE